MYETTTSIEMRNDHYTLEIQTTETQEGQREYRAYSDRRDCFVLVSLRLYYYLVRAQLFQREVEVNLDIEREGAFQALEDAHWDDVYQRQVESG